MGDWGISVEYDDHGLTCVGWMQRTDEPTIDDPMEFDNETEAAAFIASIPAMPDDIAYDRILTARRFD